MNQRIKEVVWQIIRIAILVGGIVALICWDAKGSTCRLLSLGCRARTLIE